MIRRPDGSEQVARLGFIEPGVAAGHALTDTVMRLDLGGVWALTSDVDLPSRSGEIAAWVNPAVTVATNYAGEKTVTWSSRKPCVLPGLDCGSPQLTSFTAAMIRDETSWGAAHDEYLREIGPEARSALLAFDPQDCSGAVSFPRYELIGEVTVDATPRRVDTTWRPCRDAGGFEVLAETAVPLSDGDTFVLQYGALPDAACSPQHPGLVVGTSTPGCSVQTQVFVDRLSGTLLMQPSTATGACTRD